MINLQVEQGVHTIARAAKTASRTLRRASTLDKNAALASIAEAIEANAQEIVAANEQDVANGHATGTPEPLIDRLSLTSDRLTAIADAVRQVASLPDPIGEIVRGSTLPNGMRLRQVRVPMGVIGMIYESRPNVTVDAAALTLKSGNAVILRGGRAAQHSNRVLVDTIRGALESVGLPADLVNTVDEFGREGSVALMQARGLVDLVIPRGGAGLIHTVIAQASVPVIETGVGNVHVYVDADADIDKAVEIVFNSKVQRVGVCNAAENLLVHEAVADKFLPKMLTRLAEAGVRLHGEEVLQPFTPEGVEILPATTKDWETEYLALEMAVKIVGSLDEAIEHIGHYSTGHTEAIVSENYSVINEFIAGVDTAAIMVNASTRFTDGGEFGMGAEIGISTQKLHARGPMGLVELTTTMWIAEGEGHVRQ